MQPQNVLLDNDQGSEDEDEVKSLKDDDQIIKVSEDGSHQSKKRTYSTFSNTLAELAQVDTSDP